MRGRYNARSALRDYIGFAIQGASYCELPLPSPINMQAEMAMSFACRLLSFDGLRNALRPLIGLFAPSCLFFGIPAGFLIFREALRCFSRLGLLLKLLTSSLFFEGFLLTPLLGFAFLLQSPLLFALAFAFVVNRNLPFCLAR